MTNVKRKTAPLTEQNIAALQTYAQEHGDGWQSELVGAWMAGNALDDYPGLYRLRNTHGPSWLYGYTVVPQITDEQSLVSVTSQFGRKLRIWDEGFGSLWVYRETLGAIGVVRVETFEEAHSCVVDEIMDDADMSDEDNQPDADGNLPEGLHYRGSGVPSNDGLESSVAAADLNGNLLDRLTPLLALELELTIEVRCDD